MHIRFADWYNRASIVVTSDQLTNRWDAASTFASSCDAEGVLNLVRLFVGLPPRPDSFSTEFRQAIKDKDVGFLVVNNDNELAVLAGAAIVSIFESGGRQPADIAALALKSIDAGGSGPKQPFEDAILMAEVHLSKRYRERSNVTLDANPSGEGDAPEDSLKAVTTAIGTNDPAKIGQAILRVLEVVAATGRGHNDQIAKISNAIRIYREEANIAWWVMGEFSRALKKPLHELGIAASAILCGSELADLVEVVPGPYGAKGFLMRMISTSGKHWQKQISVQRAVNETPREWRESLAARPNLDRIKDLAPTIGALVTSLETNGPDDWIPVFIAASPVNVTDLVSPLDISTRTYNENLLLKSLNG